MATPLDEVYNQVEVEDVETEGGPAPVEPPKGFKPLSTKIRQDWNDYVVWLNREKKLGGDKSLDQRDQSIALNALAEFKKTHPDNQLTADLVPHVQYEHQLMKANNTVPGMENPSQLVGEVLKGYYTDRDISNVDGWIGSKTSTQAYPLVSEIAGDPEKRRWGLDYEGAANYERSRPDLAKKQYTVTSTR